VASTILLSIVAMAQYERKVFMQIVDQRLAQVIARLRQRLNLEQIAQYPQPAADKHGYFNAGRANLACTLMPIVDELEAVLVALQSSQEQEAETEREAFRQGFHWAVVRTRTASAVIAEGIAFAAYQRGKRISPLTSPPSSETETSPASSQAGMPTYRDGQARMRARIADVLRGDFPQLAAMVEKLPVWSSESVDETVALALDDAHRTMKPLLQEELEAERVTSDVMSFRVEASSQAGIGPSEGLSAASALDLGGRDVSGVKAVPSVSGIPDGDPAERAGHEAADGVGDTGFVVPGTVVSASIVASDNKQRHGMEYAVGATSSQPQDRGELGAGIGPSPLMRYMNATTTPERDAAFLETYAERVRNGTEVAWEIPNTRATTLEDIAQRIRQGVTGDRPATMAALSTEVVAAQSSMDAGGEPAPDSIVRRALARIVADEDIGCGGAWCIAVAKEALAAVGSFNKQAGIGPWLPIASAPKDGTPVLLAHTVFKTSYVEFGWFNGECWRDAECHYGVLSPTHWMPLPPPPGDA
jgi:hypothetical protein